MSDWDKLTPAQQAGVIAARKASGHTSVFELQRVRELRVRAEAFAEACDWLRSAGFFEAAEAFEKAAFVAVPR